MTLICNGRYEMIRLLKSVDELVALPEKDWKEALERKKEMEASTDPAVLEIVNEAIRTIQKIRNSQ